jgi:hypothetical protein
LKYLLVFAISLKYARTKMANLFFACTPGFLNNIANKHYENTVCAILTLSGSDIEIYKVSENAHIDIVSFGVCNVLQFTEYDRYCNLVTNQF